MTERFANVWSWRRVPLAWCLLSRQRVRLLIALIGICFSGVLMFLQLGFRDALFETSITIHRKLQADLVMISPRSTVSIAMQRFPQRRLYQAASWSEVESVKPVRWDFAIWKNPQTGSPRAILTFGFNPDDDVLALDGLAEQKQALRLDNRVLYDRLSRAEFGEIVDLYESGQTVRTEVGGSKVQIDGLVTLGPSFGADGNLLTSDLTFRKLTGQTQDNGGIELGLIRLSPGTDAEQMAAALSDALPNDVRVLTKQGFLDFEQNYWRSGTTIGFIFNLGAAMGLVVGSVIVYQILYSDVADHLPEYATLKAMGYRYTSLLGVVMRESLFLALMGYVPAYLAGQGLYGLIRSGTRLPIGMSSQMAVSVFIAILVMCLLSGLLAMRKLGDADPAEVF